MAKRELIDTGTHKRFVRRDERGRFIRSDAVGHQSSADRRTTETNTSGKGQGDRRKARTATARSSWFADCCSRLRVSWQSVRVPCLRPPP